MLWDRSLNSHCSFKAQGTEHGAQGSGRRARGTGHGESRAGLQDRKTARPQDSDRRELGRSPRTVITPPE
jgi:hypothetical protein